MMCGGGSPLSHGACRWLRRCCLKQPASPSVHLHIDWFLQLQMNFIVVNLFDTAGGVGPF